MSGRVVYGFEVGNCLLLHDLRPARATNLVRQEARASKITAVFGDPLETVVNTYLNLTPHDLGEGVSQRPAYDLEEGDEA